MPVKDTILPQSLVASKSKFEYGSQVTSSYFCFDTKFEIVFAVFEGVLAVPDDGLVVSRVEGCEQLRLFDFVTLLDQDILHCAGNPEGEVGSKGRVNPARKTTLAAAFTANDHKGFDRP